MPEGINKKGSKVWVHCLAMLASVVVGLVGSTNIAVAQESSEQEEQRAMSAIIQYTLKYQFDKDLKVGDWVKYQEIEEQEEGERIKEIELKVTKKERGGVWIEERSEGFEVHLLVDLRTMKLLEGFGFDEEGEKREVTLLSDKEIAEIVEMAQKEMEEQAAYSQFISWEKGEETEEVDVPAGSFVCTYLEPEYSEQYKKRIEDYIEILRDHGKSDAEIDAEISGTEARLYFSKDVPRLLPVQIAIGWMPWIDVFEEVKGGLVESRHISPLKLTAYSGQKK